MAKKINTLIDKEKMKIDIKDAIEARIISNKLQIQHIVSEKVTPDTDIMEVIRTIALLKAEIKELTRIVGEI